MSKRSLHTAVISRDYDAIKNLLANGADISAKGKNGLNPISLAIKFDDKYAFDLIINKINNVYEKLVHKHTPISKDPSSIIASFVTGIEPSNNPDKNKAKNCTENETLKEYNKYIKAIDDAMIKVMYNPGKYYYKLKLCGILFVKSDQICPKKHRMLLDIAFDLNGREPNNTTEQGKFENALIANTRTLKESLLKAIADGNDQKAANLCQWFYKRQQWSYLGAGVRINQNHSKIFYYDKEISLKIYKNRKKLKKTNLKYFGYGLKTLTSHFIPYAVLIPLHGLISYGAYACIRAHDAFHGKAYLIGSALFGVSMGFFFFYNIIIASKMNTLREWKYENGSYYRSIETAVKSPLHTDRESLLKPIELPNDEKPNSKPIAK